MTNSKPKDSEKGIVEITIKVDLQKRPQGIPPNTLDILRNPFYADGIMLSMDDHVVVINPNEIFEGLQGTLKNKHAANQ